ncbi:MAG TPA: alcohol dehydrogenase catalytic domain-containing protein [Microlunatus sp.]
MRALVLAEFGRMEIREVPAPVVQNDEVLIKVDAVGICGSDVHGYTGANGRRVPGQVMGHEAAGIVLDGNGELAAGRPVTFNPLIACGRCPACKEGEQQHCPDRRVIGVNPEISAAFAEQVAVPVANVVALPADFPIGYGALIEPLAVAFHAVRRARVADHDQVVVIGGGPIGQSIVLAVRTRTTADILVSEPNAQRRELCASLGATVLDPVAEPLDDQLRKLIGGFSDVTIDAVGQSRSIADALRVTKVGGLVTLVGMGSPRLELSAFDVSTAERTVVGSFCYSDADFRAAAQWAGDHPELLAPLITDRVPLRRAPEAFAALAGQAPAAGKIIVQPNA